MTNNVSTLSPDRVSLPGDTILDLLEEYGCCQRFRENVANSAL